MILCDNIIFELQRIGGVSKYWSETIERLDSSGIYMSFLEGPSASGNVFRAQLQLKNNVIEERWPASIRRFSRTAQKSSVFHSSYYRVSSQSAANVVTIHDFMNEKFPNRFSDKILAALKKRACKHADAICVVSEQTRTDLLHHYPFVSPKKVHVTYNGVDETFYPEKSTEEFQLQESFLHPRGFFLYVGTRGFCKNFPYALEFISEANTQGLDIPLVLVGGEPLNNTEISMINNLNINLEEIEHFHEISNEELRLLYSNCLALLIPSIYEGFGLPAAEAARCGALVLTARGSALDEIVGETDFAFNLDQEEEPGRLLSMGLDNRQAQFERDRLQLRSKKFDWEKSTATLMEVYDEL